MVRIVYHEIIHVEQQWGLNKTEEIKNSTEREFLAHYRAITNNTLPPNSKMMLYANLRTVLTNEGFSINNGQVKRHGDYFNSLTPEKRAQYQKEKNILLKK